MMLPWDYSTFTVMKRFLGVKALCGYISTAVCLVTKTIHYIDLVIYYFYQCCAAFGGLGRKKKLLNGGTHLYMVQFVLIAYAKFLID